MLFKTKAKLPESRSKKELDKIEICPGLFVEHTLEN